MGIARVNSVSEFGPNLHLYGKSHEEFVI